MAADQEPSAETMTIAANLKKARKTMGLTQEQVAEKQGYP